MIAFVEPLAAVIQTCELTPVTVVLSVGRLGALVYIVASIPRVHDAALFDKAIETLKAGGVPVLLFPI